MKNLPQTVLETLAGRVRDQTKRFNPALESAPVAVLWTDERGDWEAVLPNLKSALPELFSLGEYKPAKRAGPGAWLRMVADGQAGALPHGQVPLIYMPGVANGSLRTDLREARDDPQFGPSAELQYRGIFWRQDNSKDWTLRAFFESKRNALTRRSTPSWSACTGRSVSTSAASWPRPIGARAWSTAWRHTWRARYPASEALHAGTCSACGSSSRPTVTSQK
jgi:hypothetical protein